jgi:hypothetical protein
MQTPVNASKLDKNSSAVPRGVRPQRVYQAVHRIHVSSIQFILGFELRWDIVHYNIEGRLEISRSARDGADSLLSHVNIGVFGCELDQSWNGSDDEQLRYVSPGTFLTGGHIVRLTLSCERALFSTAVPIHHAAYLLSPASGFSKCFTSRVHSSKGSKLFALSRFSMSCSKSSKAPSLASRLASSSSMMVILSFMSSASDFGAMDIKAASAAGSNGVLGASDVLPVRETSEFSMPHLSILLSCGVAIVLSVMVWEGFED